MYNADMEKKRNEQSFGEALPPENESFDEIDLLAADEPADGNEIPMGDTLSFEGDFQKEHIGLSRTRALILVAVLAAVIAGVTVFALLLPKPTGLPKFSEVMTSNHGAYLHPEYGSVDWVEIYNPTDADIDLSGYGFTNDLKHHQFRYRFPDGTVLSPGEYIVLYCTGGTEQSDSDPFCTGFNLFASGEMLFLVTPMKVEADELAVPELESDTSYARTDSGQFLVTLHPTPHEANRFE